MGTWPHKVAGAPRGATGPFRWSMPLGGPATGAPGLMAASVRPQRIRDQTRVLPGEGAEVPTHSSSLMRGRWPQPHPHPQHLPLGAEGSWVEPLAGAYQGYQETEVSPDPGNGETTPSQGRPFSWSMCPSGCPCPSRKAGLAGGGGTEEAGNGASPGEAVRDSGTQVAAGNSHPPHALSPSGGGGGHPGHAKAGSSTHGQQVREP